MGGNRRRSCCSRCADRRVEAHAGAGLRPARTGAPAVHCGSSRASANAIRVRDHRHPTAQQKGAPMARGINKVILIGNLGA
ncbi:MAG: hypothetical protein U5R48_00270, partial [Gammaproteobacteria bacterium]|nr:hypothetical protein [Gammaproteobacteria bacterium]